MRKAAAAITALLVALAIFGIYHVVVGPKVALAACDAGTIRYYAQAAQNQGNEVQTRYFRQEASVCTRLAGKRSSESTAPTTSPSPTATKPPAAPTTPAPPPTPACQVSYLADQPVADPQWENSFAGDDKALNPAFAGELMSELTVEEALQEGEYRRSIDPMLTVADATAFGVFPQMNASDQMAKTRQLAADCAEWKRVQAEVTRVMRTDYTHEVKQFGPGVYEATYALSKDGNVPLIAWDTSVNRPQGFTALVSTRASDGQQVIRRLECGFQEYHLKPQDSPPAPKAASPPAPLAAVPAPTLQPAPEKPKPVVLPQPSPGMDRTPEGVPVPKPRPTPTPTPVPTPTPKPTPTPSVPVTSSPPPGGEGGGEMPTPTTSPPPPAPTPVETAPPPPPATCPPETPFGSPPNCKDGPAQDPGNNDNAGYAGGAEQGGSAEGPTTDPGAGQPPATYTPPAPPAGSSSGNQAPGADPAPTGEPPANEGAPPSAPVGGDPCAGPNPPQEFCG